MGMLLERGGSDASDISELIAADTPREVQIVFGSLFNHFRNIASQLNAQMGFVGVAEDEHALHEMGIHLAKATGCKTSEAFTQLIRDEFHKRMQQANIPVPMQFACGQ